MLFCLLCALVFSLLAAGPAPAAQTAESLQYQIVPRQALPTSCGYAVCAAALRLAGCDVALAPGEGAQRSAAYPATAPYSNLAVDEALLLARYGPVDGANVPERLSLAQISAILADFNVPSATLKGSLSNTILPLLERGTPLIIHYEHPVQHFALALGADADQIYVADPADGLTSLSYPELERRMSGYFLVPLPFLRAPFMTMPPLTVTSNRTATSNGIVDSDTIAPTNIEAAIAFIKNRNALLKTSIPVSVPTTGPALQKSEPFANTNLHYRLSMSLEALPSESESQTAPGILTSLVSARFFPLNPQLSFDIETPLGASFDIACKALPLQPEFALGALYWTSEGHGIWACFDAKNTIGGWAFSPYLGYYASRLASPTLFTSKFGLGLELADRASHSSIADIAEPFESVLSHSTGIKLATISLKSRLTLEYALTGSLCTYASIDQTFRYAIGDSSAASSLATSQGFESSSKGNLAFTQGPRSFWDATIKGGIRIPVGNFVLSTGAIVGLTAYSPKGGLYVSVQH